MEIITTHKNADFDGLACMMAAQLLYPDAVAVRPNDLNPNLKAFLSIHKDVFDTWRPGDIDYDEVTKLIVVDTGSWNRLDNQVKVLEKRDDLAIEIWDHHPKGNIPAGTAHYEETGAAVSLLVREIRKAGLSIEPIQATLFLLGIYEDTGSLSFPSTQPDDAHAVAWLLEQGADLKVLSTFLRPVYGERQKEVLFEMMQEAVTERIDVKGHDVAITRLTIDGHVANLSVVINMFREILNVDAVFGIFTEGERNSTFVIGRSKTEEINVGAVMRTLGGGGHPAAGSAMVRNVVPDAVLEQVRDLLSGNLQSSVQLGDLMSFPVVTVESDTPMNEVGKILRNKGCTGLPVVEHGKLVGVVSRRDFRKIRKKSQNTAPVRAFMAPDPVTIEPGKSPMEAAKLMVKHDIGRLPVVEEGQIIGIVSRSDTIRYFYDLLPE